MSTAALTQLGSDLERLGLDTYVEALAASQQRIAALEAAACAVAFHTLAITQPGERGGCWCCVCGENAHRNDCPVGTLAALLEE